MSPPRIVGVALQDPLDPLTWSGITRHLFGALGRRGAVAGAVAAWPPAPAVALAKAVAVATPRELWRERYESGRTLRAALSVAGGVRARRLDRAPDALLQIGAWYDFSRVPGLHPGLRCSYHDCNLAASLERGRFATDANARHVRRTLSAENRVFDRLDLIMTMSEWLRRSFIEDCGQDPAKVVNVGAGANLVAVPDLAERAWERPRLLFVGVEWERKGGPEVLAAFRRVRHEMPEAELWIAGPAQPATRAEEPGVRWLGRILRRTPEGDAAMHRLYRQATCFVMPSRFEPFGIAFLEAMAYGLPCVGARVCAIGEIIEEGVSGSLVPPGDADALAEELLTLVRDPERCRAMGSAGRERLLAQYTWDHVAERMLTEIERSLGKR
jgi:alpha-maltose-1-phosphate synthase